MKKWLVLLFLMVSALLAACSDIEKVEDKQETVKVGIRSSELRTWQYIKEQAEKEGVEIEIVNFSSAYDPNQALVEGDIDINAFQDVAYLDSFKENVTSNIVPIGTMIIVTLGLFSDSY